MTRDGPTDQRTCGPMDLRTDTTSYIDATRDRDEKSHLKKRKFLNFVLQEKKVLILDFFFPFFALSKNPARVLVLVGGLSAINRYYIYPHICHGSSKQGYAIDITSSSSHISSPSIVAIRKYLGPLTFSLFLNNYVKRIDFFC